MRGRPDAGAELVLAADAIVCVADLAGLAEAARVLTPGSCCAFTTETHDGGGLILGAGLRYAHAAAYVCASVEACGLRSTAGKPFPPATRTTCRARAGGGGRGKLAGLDATRLPYGGVASETSAHGYCRDAGMSDQGAITADPDE